MKNVLGRVVLGFTLLGAVSLAHAVPVTFDLTYSGAIFGNTATGAGTITFEDTVLPNPGPAIFNVSAATLGITAFSITISGASAGNGTFGLADVDNWIWDVTAPLDLTTELVGQLGFDDFNWCGFDFDGCTAPAPGGAGQFLIITNAEAVDGDSLMLTSMAPSRPAPVPEPASLALVAIGLAGVAFRRRRAA